MNHFAISSLFIIISTVSMSIWMFARSNGKKHNIVWGIFCLFVAVWGIGSFFATTTLNYQISFFWWKFANIGSIFSPILFFHFICEYTRKKTVILPAVYIVGGILLIINYFAEELYFAHLSFVFDQFYFIDWTTYKSPFYLYAYLILDWIVLLYGFSLLISKYRVSHPKRRNQIKYFFVGSAIGWVGGHGDYLLAFGYKVYPYSNFLIVLYVLIIGYAIIRHQFLNIRMIYEKSIIYSISITAVSLLYLLSVLILEKLVQDIVGYKALGISITMAFMLGLLFIPIQQEIQHFMDKYFFKGSTEEMATQNEQLRQEIIQTEKYKTLSTLATGIAHEVKNPLTSIKTFCEHLPNRLDDEFFLKKFAALVGREVDRIDDMTHQLLDYGKPAPLVIKRTDIYKLIDNTIDILSSKCVHQKIDVVKNLHDDHRLELNIDPNQLRQALLNIFLNAIEAMPNGGTLTITSSISSRSYFVITIGDTGCGIPRNELSRIFDPFFSKKDEGTGLGLSITQSLIENHKGIIQIKSKVGSGTSVRIDLPLNRENTRNLADG